MSSTHVVTITTTEDLGVTTDVSSRAFHQLNKFGAFLHGVAQGQRSATVDVQTDSGDATAASGTVTISSGSGTITATINGVAISVTWATSDTNSATLLKNAINASADALVSGVVSATSALGVVTVTATTKGKSGNWITLAASGTGATASGSGRLTGGANASANSITF